MGNNANAVASFIAGFSSAHQSFDGVCVKYAMKNWTSRLSFFDAQRFPELNKCAEYYSGTRYYGSDMQREADGRVSVPGCRAAILSAPWALKNPI